MLEQEGNMPVEWEHRALCDLRNNVIYKLWLCSYVGIFVCGVCFLIVPHSSSFGLGRLSSGLRHFLGIFTYILIPIVRVTDEA